MTSILIATSFLLLLISGVVLFVSPPGRVANWTDWQMIGLSKHGWIDVHTWFGAVFVLTAVFHLMFNFRPLLNYFRDRMTRRLGWRWEWMAAVTVCGGVFAGVQTRMPPFSNLLNFGERVKWSWEDPRAAAPQPHAELLSLKDLAGQANVPYETAVERLEARGIAAVQPDMVVQDVARANGVSAQRVYEIIQGQSSGGLGSGHGADGGRGGFAKGGGAGWQTLAQYCTARSLDLTNAAARLEARGIKFAVDWTLRDIARENGYDRPYEIIDILEAQTP